MPRSIQSMRFLSEEERDTLQEIMDEQASQEKKHKGERTLAGYWSKIKSASANPITFAAAAWGFFYFWAYVSVPAGAQLAAWHRRLRGQLVRLR